MRKRVAVRELYDKVKMSIDDVQYLQEKIKRKDLDGDTVRGVCFCAAGGACACAALRCAAQHAPALPGCLRPARRFSCT